MKKYILAVALVFATITNCNADFFFRFSDTNIAPNVSTQVDLFLAASPSAGFQKLSYAEFNLTSAIGMGNSTITNFVFDSAFGNNPFLGNSSANVSGGVLLGRLYSSGLTGIDAVNNQVRLGTITFSGGALSNSTNFTFTDPGNVSNASLTGANVNVITNSDPFGSPVDSMVFASPQNSISITAVPEPSSMALLGLVGLAGVGVRYARTRKSRVAAGK